MKQNINIEAEDSELILKNKVGDHVIIPKNKRAEVQQMLKDGCHGCIDALVETLPVMDDYAQDGTVVPNGKTINVRMPDNTIKTMATSSPEYAELYQSGALANYDKKTDTYIATPLKEVEIKAQKPKSFVQDIAHRITTDINANSSSVGGALIQGLISPLTMPQLAATKAVTGKAEYPSEAMEIENPIGAMAVDMIADPSNLVGVGLVGKLSKADKVIDATKAGSKVLNKTDDIAKQLPVSGNVGIDDGITNPFKGKFDLPDSYKKRILEEYRLNNLKELNSKEANEVLENFIARINTPEGQKRMKELGILYPNDAKKFYNDLKIFEDNHTYAYYSPSRGRIGMHPELESKAIVTRHEIEHSVRDVINQSKLDKYNQDSGNFKYLSNRKAGKKALEDAKKPTTDIDDLLNNLELRRTPEKVDWDKLKSERIGEVKDANRLNEYFTDKRRATNYFASGSEGNEKSAFLAEVQQYMIDKNIIPKTSYTEVTPEMVKNTFVDAMFDESGGGKYLRLFNIMKPTEANYKLISEGLNKMLGLVPPAAIIGAGAAIKSQQNDKTE